MLAAGTNVVYVTVVILAAALVAGWALSSLLSRAVDATNEALDWVERRMFAAMRPVEHTILCVLIIGLSLIVARFPNVGLWRFVTQSVIAGPPAQGPLLAAATALLALLLFAATQLRSLGSDSATEDHHMGEGVNTHLYRRSRAVHMLGLPVFHVSIVALFILPLALPILPKAGPEWLTGFFEAPPIELTISIWIACYAVASGVLLLNVLTVLRYSATMFSNRDAVKHSIEYWLAEEAAKDYARLFDSHRDAHQRARDLASLWTEHHLDRASELPEAEQLRYVRLTLGRPQYQLLRGRARERLLHLSNKTYPRPLRFLGRLSPDGAAWRFMRRTNLAAALLGQRVDISEARTQAFVARLRKQELSEDLRAWLIAVCIEEANASDTDFEALSLAAAIAQPDTASTHRQTFVEAAERLRYKSVEVASRRVSLSHKHDISGSGESETLQLERLTAHVYRDLTDVLVSAPVSGPTRAERTKLLTKLLQSADGLRHRPTREVLLRELIAAIIDHALLRNPETNIGDLSAFAPLFQRDPLPTPGVPPNPSGISQVIAEQCFFVLLSTNQLTPAARDALLQFVAGWRVPTSLFFGLWHGAHSGYLLTVADLAPFATALRKLGWERDEMLADLAAAGHGALSESPIGHLLTPNALQWFLESLNRQLSLGLCLEFVSESKTWPRSTPSVVQFVQWHLLVSEQRVAWPDFSDAANVSDEASRFAQELRALAHDWAAIDTHRARSLNMLMSAVPEETAGPVELVTPRGFV